jgi:hypothetical protein
MRVVAALEGEAGFRRRKVVRVTGIEHMLAIGISARNGRFREAVAAFLKDCSWPILLKNSVSAQGRKISGAMARRDREEPRVYHPTAIALREPSRFAYAKTCPKLSLSTPGRRKSGRTGKPSFSTELTGLRHWRMTAFYWNLRQ